MHRKKMGRDCLVGALPAVADQGLACGNRTIRRALMAGFSLFIAG